MSRTIDMSGGVEALDDDEVLYLAQRDNRDAQAEMRSRGLSLSNETDLENAPYFGDANTKGRTVEELEEVARTSPHHVDDEDDEDDSDEYDDEEVVDYTTWNVDQLRAELIRRNEEEGGDFSIEGRKAELVARLEEADEANSGE